MKKWILVFTQLVCMQLISLIILFSPAKDHIQSWLFPNENKLLAVVYGDVAGDGTFVKVLKFKTKDGIRIEFLKQDYDGMKTLIAQKDIHHPYNGFFEYRGNSVQLAMGDVNGDGIMEVMAPSFDKNLIAHLNVYSYHQEHDTFAPYNKKAMSRFN